MVYTCSIYRLYSYMLYKNIHDIIIIKQDRGRRVVIMNKPKYHDKYFKL